MKVHRVVKSDGATPDGYMVRCHGPCFAHHYDTRWTFNGDFDKPTFRASMLVEGYIGTKNGVDQHGRCHSFVTDGRIQYLDDCAHEFKGQTLDLLDMDTP